MATDFDKKIYLKKFHFMDVDVRKSGGAQRTAPEGTPGRDVEPKI